MTFVKGKKLLVFCAKEDGEMDLTLYRVFINNPNLFLIYLLDTPLRLKTLDHPLAFRAQLDAFFDPFLHILSFTMWKDQVCSQYAITPPEFYIYFFYSKGLVIIL